MFSESSESDLEEEKSAEYEENNVIYPRMDH
jgi:hypothetical protein